MASLQKLLKKNLYHPRGRENGLTLEESEKFRKKFPGTRGMKKDIQEEEETSTYPAAGCGRCFGSFLKTQEKR